VLPVPALVAVLVGVIAFTPALRFALTPALGDIATYVLPLTRFDGLAFGALLAIALRSEVRPLVFTWSRRLVVPAMRVVFAVVAAPFGIEARYPLWFAAVGCSLVGAAFTVLTARALDPTSSSRPLLEWRPLTYIGTLCYGLYVWHVLVGCSIRHLLDSLGLKPPLEPLGVVWFGLSVLAAAASHRFIEKPFLDMKRHVRLGNLRSRLPSLPGVSAEAPLPSRPG
jgi:peptidoglycan/LPS O-acetylase OafA/YrhL